MRTTSEPADEPGDPGRDDDVVSAERHLREKLRRQGGIPTAHDNYLLWLVERARSGAAPEHAELRRAVRLVTAPRFQDPVARLSRPLDEVVRAMGVQRSSYLASQGARSAVEWRGRPLVKTVYDVAAYPMLVSELRPRAVIELGSGSGASAIWLADVAAAHGVCPRIISIDRVEVTVEDPRVDFVRGDVAALADVLPADLLAALQHPWLVIEDAHAHVRDVLAFFDARLVAGDYLIVEDSMSKRDDLLALVERSQGRYVLDTRFLDLFGENTTCAVDSIFRRQ